MTSGNFQTNPLPRLIVAIRGMVGLQDDKGDWHTRQQIEHYFDVVSETSHEYDGMVSSFENDSAFITFSSAKNALKATQLILDRLMEEEAVKSESESSPLDATSKIIPLSVRLGLHYGPLDVGVGELSGIVSDQTGKMVTRARPSQIITSQIFIDQIKDEEVNTKPLGTISDSSGNIEMFEIVTQHSGKSADQTLQPENVPQGVGVGDATQIILAFQGTQITVSESQPIVVMGRDVNNDFIVNVETASRQHARVEFEHGCFMISDHSTNGTYVQSANGQPVFLNQQQIQLQASGVISLGQPITENSLLIEYTCQ